MSVGPILSIFSGVVAGRLVDGKGTGFMALAGLAAMTVGVIALALLPSIFGVPAYVGAIAVLAPGYQLFQAANNTSVMVGVRPEKRGALSGLLNLSRNLGLITGASLMGAVFAFFSASSGAIAENQTAGFRATFLLATALMVIALAVAAWAGRQSEYLKPIA
jgi:MFS family permease